MPEFSNTYPQREHNCAGHADGCSLGHHRSTSEVICLNQVSFSYQPVAKADSAHLVLEDIQLHVGRGENVGIIGPNGAGKSTLIKIIVGLLRPTRGSVSVLGMTPHEACRRGDIIGYVPQRSRAEWRFPLSVRQVVEMGLFGKTGMFRRPSREDRDRVSHLMERMGVAHIAEKPIGELSGGQQQRVLLARSLVAGPQLLLLDEPMSGIDEVGQQQIAQLIREFHRDLKLTVIIVSHDIDSLAAGCTKVACINRTVHYHDVPERLTPEVLKSVFRHRFDLLFRLNDETGSKTLP